MTPEQIIDEVIVSLENLKLAMIAEKSDLRDELTIILNNLNGSIGALGDFVQRNYPAAEVTDG